MYLLIWVLSVSATKFSGTWIGLVHLYSSRICDSVKNKVGSKYVFFRGKDDLYLY